MRVLCQLSPHIRRGLDRAYSGDLIVENSNNSVEHHPYRDPCTPRFGMVLCDTQAYFDIRFESSILVHKLDFRWFERIVFWQNDLAMIQSLVKICLQWSCDGEVPHEEVVGQGGSEQVWRSLLGNGFHLLRDAILSDPLGHNIGMFRIIKWALCCVQREKGEDLCDLSRVPPQIADDCHPSLIQLTSTRLQPLCLPARSSR